MNQKLREAIDSAAKRLSEMSKEEFAALLKSSEGSDLLPFIREHLRAQILFPYPPEAIGTARDREEETQETITRFEENFAKQTQALAERNAQLAAALAEIEKLKAAEKIHLENSASKWEIITELRVENAALREGIAGEGGKG